MATTILSLTPAGATTAPPDIPVDQPAGDSVDATSGQATTTDVAGPEATPPLEPATLGRVETAVGSAFAAAVSPADEATFVSMINQLRSSQGLNSLTLDTELTAQARQWTQVMDDADHLHHAPDLSVGITADWRVLGENVGVHSINDLDALFQAFIKSPTHYANLVDPRFTHVGVGVIQADDGYVWTTHRFMAAQSATPAPTQPPTTAAPVTQPPATQAPTQPPTTQAPTTASTQPPSTAPTTAPTTAAPAPSNAEPGSSDSTTAGNGQAAAAPTAADDATTAVAANTTSGAASTAEADSASPRLQLDADLIGDIIDEVAQSGL